MSVLLELGKKLNEYQSILTAIAQKKSPVAVYGISAVHCAHLGAMLLGDLSCPIVYLAKDEERAKRLCSDMVGLGAEEPILLPGRDFIFHKIENISREYEQKKIEALWRIGKTQRPIVVTTPEALMARCIPQKRLLEQAITIRFDGEYSIQSLCTALVDMGYKRFAAVEGIGQFAQRGDILDIFMAGGEHPVRIEFFGDTVDSMSYFDVNTQRRIRTVPEITVLPTCEAMGNGEEIAGRLKEQAEKVKNTELSSALKQGAELLQSGVQINLDPYMPLLYGPLQTPMDYLPKDTLFILEDSPAVLEGAEGFEFRINEGVERLLADGVLVPGHCDFILSAHSIKTMLMDSITLLFDTFLASSSLPPKEIISVMAKQLPAYGGSFETAANDIESYSLRDYITFVLAGGEKRAKNMVQILEERGIKTAQLETVPKQGKIYVLPQSVSAGFEYPSLHIAVISEGQIAAKGKKATTTAKSGKNRLQSFTDLGVGDLVVHDHHGIGRFVAMEKIVQDGTPRDYIKIAFAGTDFLYVPATSLGLISKYIGAAEDSGVKLSKMGGVTWEKAKTKAKKAAKDLAEYLVGLYAKRKEAQGFAFAPDDDWQKSFEESFEFDETPDQMVAAQEIKEDMESPHPMDRLLCGDVGFGKTEVAFRAVMKCMLSGKQAAILVPTTVLARQHFLTALSRFGSYPIKIETLSRFRTPKMQKEICRKVHDGEVDLVIGTHRLLQKDVKFKDLGLLVVDEEQRFGVSHKEKIKEMSIGIDVLTLSATPIPRTLNMALSGIRDMSVLEEAPRDRLPVQTFVLEHDDRVLFDAIATEINRGGQVYYLHNHIESIESVAAKIRQRFPNISVEAAHGRMDESHMSDIMNRLYGGEIDVLVCTTIIETGIDVPNVNTIIIENADHMGLSQLHQIRGRVGRSHRHAFAYLTYRRGKVLSEISQKRLSAIREFAEFGAGFKIAMRDLEIRGAGNVLGAEQSGHMMSVGYDMYLKLLEEAVNELSEHPGQSKVSCVVDINTDARLPEQYVADPGQRIDLYRRIGQVQTQESYEDVLDELIDRFGEPPKEAVTLLAVALLRAAGSNAGISEISQKGKTLLFKFAVPNVEKAAITASLDRFKTRIRFNATGAPYITLSILDKEKPLELAADFVKAYSES